MIFFLHLLLHLWHSYSSTSQAFQIHIYGFISSIMSFSHPPSQTFPHIPCPGSFPSVPNLQSTVPSFIYPNLFSTLIHPPPAYYLQPGTSVLIQTIMSFLTSCPSLPLSLLFTTIICFHSHLLATLFSIIPPFSLFSITSFLLLPPLSSSGLLRPSDTPPHLAFALDNYRVSDFLTAILYLFPYYCYEASSSSVHFTNMFKFWSLFGVFAVFLSFWALVLVLLCFFSLVAIVFIICVVVLLFSLVSLLVTRLHFLLWSVS